ncbi:MAG: T9SS type A sorting domain-containing protein, partial [Bacteroidetes bacterium]|nr:T9SS type A sorting domain-containing protein [Bacteroidota bacterium]MBU1718560.1 T9SS type A sorting domain-containing protein [Bacteroidota bacterium]
TGNKSIGLGGQLDAADGWNLVGNPFPSAVDWDAGGWTKTTVRSNTFYFRTNGAYASYNGNTKVGTGGATNIIPPCQGIWLKDSTDAGGTLTVPQSARVHDVSTNFLKDNKADKSDSPVISRLNIISSNGPLTDETVICFVAPSSKNADGFDSEKLFITDANYPQVYTLTDDNYKMVINSFPAEDAVTEIPLGFKVGVAGTFTFDFSGSETLESSTTVYLEDTKTGDIQDLKSNPVYTFASGATTTNTRFKIIFSQSTLPVELLGFRAVCGEENVVLSWATASENNNAGFTIERSADAVNFSEIGLLAGAGSSNLVLRYSFSDDNPDRTAIYYRLKQTDMNGSVSYSKIIQVTCQIDDAGFQVSDPVVFNDNIEVEVLNSKGTEVLIDIVDLKGDVIFGRHFSTTGNLDKFEINGFQLASGMYMLRVSNGEEQMTRKFFYD